MSRFGAARVIVRGLIPDLYATYQSANKALEFLRSINLGYRKKDFLADWREILGLKAKEEVWKYIRKEYKPSVDLFIKSEQKLYQPFVYIGKIEYLDTEGVLREMTISHGEDELITIQEAEDIFAEMVTEQVELYGVSKIVGIKVIGGKRR